MSYDLYLLRKADAGDDPAAAYARLEEGDDREPTLEEERELRELAADLRAANPGLDLSEPEQGFLLQLGYESENPIVIDVGVSEITMSWSYGAGDPGPALDEVRLYLPVFERHGYLAYDPQLEQVFDYERDRDAAREVHDDVQRRVFEKYGVEQRPWWKRLLGR